MSIGFFLKESLKKAVGANIDQDVIENWVKEIGDKLPRGNGNFDVTFTTSGDTMVVGTFNKHDDSTFTVDVWVCKIEQRGTTRGGVSQPVQIDAFCRCASPRLKRVDISSSLGYDFCEACKKEKK